MNKIYLIVGIIWMAAICLPAQYLFNTMTKEQGLSANNVYCILKDSAGFIWAGTQNGLNRFDGASFKVYNRANKNIDPIVDENITALEEYGRGRIRVGTRSGLFEFNKFTGKFKPTIIEDEHGSIQHNLYIMDLYKDRSNRLWIGTSKGFYLLREGKAIAAECVYPDAHILSNIKSHNITTLNDKDAFWLGTDKGIMQVDCEAGKVYSFNNNPNHLSIFTETAIQSLSTDHKGNVWWSGTSHPLAFYDVVANKSIDVTYFDQHSKLKVPGDGCNRMFVDNKKRLWISSYYYRIFVRETDGRITILPNESPNPFKPTGGIFYDIIQDEEGTIWLCNGNGISKLNADNYLQNVVEVKSDSTLELADVVLINCYLQSENGDWWFGKDDGLYRYDHHFRKLNEFKLTGSQHQINRIFDLMWYKNEIWCATGDGIKIFNSEKHTFRKLHYHPQLKLKSNKAVVWFYKDLRGYIWIPLWLDALSRFDPATSEIIKYDGSNPQHGDIKNTNVVSYVEISDSILWFNHGTNGLRVYNHNTNSFSQLPDSNTVKTLSQVIIYSMIMDHDGYIWVATPNRGVFKLNTEGKLLDSLNTENGFNTSSVYSMAVDSSGWIWATTPDGLHYFDPKDKRVRRLNINLKLPLGDGWNVLRITGDSLIVTNMDRLILVNLKNVKKRYSNLNPVISSFSVFENEIPISQTEGLNLDYKENFFTIHYSSLHHMDIASLQYVYRLEGFDKDWINAGRNQIAAYTNVPDGKYIFKVKCIDPNGNPSEATMLPILIESPFWKTWWFPLCILFMLSGLVYWILKLKESSIRRKEIDKTIQYFVNSVYEENTVNEICWDIARNCISKLHFEDCVVYLYDEQKNRYVQKSAFGPKNQTEHEIINQMEIEPGKGIVGTVGLTAIPLLVNDTSKDHRYIVDDEIRYSELTVPIIHDGKVIGIIDSEHPRKNFFTEEHLRAVCSIASISSNKIAEAQAEAYAKENEIKLLEINKLLAESQLMALRAQMNPHFVFNCLNSIQECIVTQKYGEASNYLNKFSKLFRTVLNNSGKNLVSITEEKEVLELYLVLEHMRFDQSFDYKITVDEDLEADEILIPSMLVQPYVENALWHGLMHKEGERKLEIVFNRLNENVYECIIDDNGIGRARSFDLKEQQSKSKRHESKGLKISKDRLDVLSRQGYHTNLEIIDKPNNGGTTVKIELSTYLNY